MNRSIAAAAVLASLAAPAVGLAVGEPVNGFPSWAERVIHEWTNRARCDPQVEMTACGAACGEKACYAPVEPLAWADAAGRAARFHADEMRLQGYFAHDSACAVVSNIASLYPDTCDGSASCACGGAGSTAWYTRLGLFGLTAAGENIESGASDPNSAFYLWLYESSSSTTCAFSSANGHRWGILKNAGALGTGVSSALGVMDFVGSAAAVPKIPSGAHYPRQAATIEAWANWYDGAGPQAAVVVVDGACTAMTRERGSLTNGAWRAVLTGFGTGCHRYYFAFKDSAGAVVTYPTTGSYGIGDAACADFTTTRPALGSGCGAVSACDPAPGGCDDGNPCTTDACEATGCTHVALGDGTPCGDGDVCNGAETCQSGVCAPGASLDCDDGNPCTVDACGAANGCTYSAASVDTACSDGQDCNGLEHCDGAGACVPGVTCQGVNPSPPEDSGCGCGTGSGPANLALGLVALALAVPGRRRRRG